MKRRVKATPSCLTYDKREFNLGCIPFTTKMMRRFLKGGATSVIIETEIEQCNMEELPQKGEFFFIGEPFRRKYGMKDGYEIVYSIQYDADNNEYILNDIDESLDEYGTLLPANAMMEYESRVLIRVRSCRYRRLQSLPLQKVIHDNLYGVAKTRRVILLEFDVVTSDEISEYYRQREFEYLFENYF